MFKNGLYNLLGTIVRLALSIVSVPLLLKFLGSAEYGLYAILTAIINIAVLSEWSICMVLIVFIAQDSNESLNHPSTSSLAQTLRQAFFLVVGLAVITALLLWLTSPWIALAFPNLSQPDKLLLLRGCRLSALVVFFRLLQQYFVGLEQAYGQYKMLNSINTILTISQTILILLAAYFDLGLLSLIGIQALLTALFLGVHGIYCYRNKWLSQLRWRGPIDWNQFRQMIAYGSRTFVGGVGSAFFSQGDRLVVGRLLGLEASGVYAALTNVATQIHTLSTIAVQPLVPTLTQLVAQKNKTEYGSQETHQSIKTIVSRALLFNATLAVGLGCTLLMLSPEVSVFLFKNKLSSPFETITTLKIIATIYTLYSMNAVGYYMLFAIKREIVTTATSLICGPLSLGFIGLLTFTHGLTGAFIGNAGYLLTLVMLIIALKEYKLPGQVWTKSVQYPMLVFAAICALSLSDMPLLLRLFTLVIALCALSVPLYRQGLQYFLNKRR